MPLNHLVQRAIAALFLLTCSAGANAALVHNLPVNVGGVDYIATFHDFDTTRSFNSLWDSVTADGDFTNDGVAPFNTFPTFWNSQALAEEARDVIIAALGASDHVDETGSNSDMFLIPFEVIGLPSRIGVATDLNPSLAAESPQSLTGALRTSPFNEQMAWVTFEQAAPSPAPAPTPLLLLAAGAIVLRSKRRKRGWL